MDETAYIKVVFQYLRNHFPTMSLYISGSRVLSQPLFKIRYP